MCLQSLLPLRDAHLSSDLSMSGSSTDYVLNLRYLLLTEAMEAILIKVMLGENSLPRLGGLLESLVIDQIFVFFDL